MNFPVARALNVGTQIHTAPAAFGICLYGMLPKKTYG
jgi:hypothetical protein